MHTLRDTHHTQNVNTPPPEKKAVAVTPSQERIILKPIFNFFTILKNQFFQTNTDSCHEKNHSIYICARKHTMHN